MTMSNAVRETERNSYNPSVRNNPSSCQKSIQMILEGELVEAYDSSNSL